MVYINLSRLTREDLAAHLQQLAAAQRLIVDVRGPPNSGWINLIAHLAASELRLAPTNIPIYTQPDQRGVVFEDLSWPIAPQAPHFNARAVFITDGRAVSAAETVMQIVEHYRLGDIVGAPTAGTNGNYNAARILSGHVINWTGMQVTRYDGSHFHGLGVQPTIPVERTIAGIRAGRDELLDAAIAAARAP